MKNIISAVIILALYMGAGSLQAQNKKHEFREASAFVDGATLHYRIGGSGPVLLMLHGMTLTGEQWMPFAHAFTDSFTVVLVDLPGHGGSSPFPDTFSFEKTAQRVLGLLDQLGAQKACGIGHSAGGMTLLQMVKLQPKRLEAMVLVNAPHYLGPEAREITRKDKFELLQPNVVEFYRMLHPGGEEQARRIYRQYNGLTDNQESIPKTLLAGFQTPTLLVWGDSDPAFPLEIPMEMYRALPNAALWVIPQQGHTPIWADLGGDAKAGERFVEIAHDFLIRKKVVKPSWF